MLCGQVGMDMGIGMVSCIRTNVAYLVVSNRGGGQGSGDKHHPKVKGGGADGLASVGMQIRPACGWVQMSECADWLTWVGLWLWQSSMQEVVLIVLTPLTPLSTCATFLTTQQSLLDNAQLKVMDTWRCPMPCLIPKPTSPSSGGHF